MEQRRRAGGRRAVRPAGTVGGDERWLRSTVPAPAVASPAAPPDRSAAEVAEPAIPRRSLDDSDLGWGDRADDSNDERLQQNRPPHW